MADRPTKVQLKPFAELIDSGILWLVNATIFHPRGFALTLGQDEYGNCTGWAILGDGLEHWQFSDEEHDEIESKFQLVSELLKPRCERDGD